MRGAVGGEQEGGRPAGVAQRQEDVALEQGEQRQAEKPEQTGFFHPRQERVSRKCRVLEVTSEIGFKRAAGTEVRKTTRKGKEVMATKVRVGVTLGAGRGTGDKSPLGAFGVTSNILFLDLSVVIKVFILII